MVPWGALGQEYLKSTGVHFPLLLAIFVVSFALSGRKAVVWLKHLLAVPFQFYFCVVPCLASCSKLMN